MVTVLWTGSDRFGHAVSTSLHGLPPNFTHALNICLGRFLSLFWSARQWCSMLQQSFVVHVRQPASTKEVMPTWSLHLHQGGSIRTQLWALICFGFGFGQVKICFSLTLQFSFGKKLRTDLVNSMFLVQCTQRMKAKTKNKTNSSDVTADRAPAHAQV